MSTVKCMLAALVIVFDSRAGETVVRTAKDIVLQKAGHMDLDDGYGTHPLANGWGAGLPRPNDYRPDLHCGSVHGPDRHLKGTDGASFLFPIGHGALDAG